MLSLNINDLFVNVNSNFIVIIIQTSEQKTKTICSPLSLFVGGGAIKYFSPQFNLISIRLVSSNIWWNCFPQASSSLIFAIYK